MREVVLGLIHGGGVFLDFRQEMNHPWRKGCRAEAPGGTITKCHCESLSAVCACKHIAPNMADALIRGSESLGRLPGEALGVAGRAGDRDSPRDQLMQGRAHKLVLGLLMPGCGPCVDAAAGQDACVVPLAPLPQL